MTPEITPTAFTLFIFLLIPVVSKPQEASTIVINGANSTLLSPNRVFSLGFFSLDGGLSLHLGIWYASIPIRTYVWVANRPSPFKQRILTLTLTPSGQLSVVSNNNSSSALWSTDNLSPASKVSLLDTGNLILTTSAGEIVWQSFDFPADTWLPNMTVTNLKPLISWRSPSDPSHGMYSLRLRPPEYGEFELVYNGSVRYWSTGNWTGTQFSGVPEMSVPYIYSFQFSNPYTPDAEFSYSETTPAATSAGILSRFAVDFSGRVVQHTWSEQAASWKEFWSRPESACHVYGRCGDLGICREEIWPCECAGELDPVDADAWNSGDFSRGCARKAGGADDRFMNVGSVHFDGARADEIRGVGRESCEESCRSNSSCFGIEYDSEMNLCHNLYGNAFNLGNSTTASPVLYLRVSSSSSRSRKMDGKWKKIAALAGSICAFLTMAGALVLILLLYRWKRPKRNRNASDELNIPVTNLRVFTYKELSAATRNFSEKLGHGGFGTVFLGELPDSTKVAVKRLERPNGGDREFRAEVRTIGNIQHVNLVRLRGFCSEDPHRLLAYDYMPNGPLSAYLSSNDRNSSPPKILSWQSRFRIAVGTARGIAYLHEECRDCIIHCDVKPENILLDGDCVPRVSDFGLAKLMGRDFSRVLATMRGTRGYMAPEWISGVAITTKADVYSYGMTLLEILSGRRNAAAAAAAAAAAEEAESWYFPAWVARRIVEGDVLGTVDPALGAEYDAGEAVRVGMVAVWCIQDEETARPAMGEVVKMLEGTVAVAAPPLPKLLQALVSGASFAREGIASNGTSESG